MKFVCADLSTLCAQHIVVLRGEGHVAERLKPIGQHRVRVNHTRHFRAVQMAVQVEKAAAFRNRRETVKNCIRYGFSHGNVV